MFGVSAFAQTPFASLAGVSSVIFVIESIQSDDSSTQISVFLQSLAEHITLAEFDATTGDFFDGVVEAVSMADSSTAGAVFSLYHL